MIMYVVNLAVIIMCACAIQHIFFIFFIFFIFYDETCDDKVSETRSTHFLDPLRLS